MRKQSFLLLLFISVAGLSVGQTSQDSIRIAETTWNEKEIKPGLIWKQAHYDTLFGSQQEINLLEMDLLQEDLRLSIEGFSDTLHFTSDVAVKNQAIVGINGGFFNVQDGGGTTLIKKNGQTINNTTLLDQSSKRTERSNGALVFNDKKVSIVPGDDRDVQWDTKLRAENVMVCGPLLMLNKQQIPLERNPFNDNRHPRSAVAVKKNNRLILITVDGRNAKAQGMTLPELAYFLKVFGVDHALNLDGGGSTTLFVAGEGTNGIVNYPSDNKLFDHKGERKVANMILIH